MNCDEPGRLGWLEDTRLPHVLVTVGRLHLLDELEREYLVILCSTDDSTTKCLTHDLFSQSTRTTHETVTVRVVLVSPDERATVLEQDKRFVAFNRCAKTDTTQ